MTKKRFRHTYIHTYTAYILSVFQVKVGSKKIYFRKLLPIFGPSSLNSTNQFEIIQDFTVNPNQNFPQIIQGGRASLIIALNSGYYNSIYSYLINLSIMNQSKPVDYVSPEVLPASVNAFKQMNSTNYLLIFYGTATNFSQVQSQQGGVVQISSPLPLQQNSLCVYDF
ncbi:hypothetical protein ABPG72_005022 [Tetrahymena utriculariae]